MKTYCVVNPKTNRCVTTYSENETSINCRYQPTTKRCSSIKTKYLSSTKKKTLHHLFDDIIAERKSPRKTLKKTVKRKTPGLKIKQQKNVDYYGYQVESHVKTYLNKLVFKTPVKNFRKIANEMNLYIPLNQYPTDKKVREYLVNEILELAQNDARDKFSSNIIVVENIKRVIKNDYDLSALFMSDPEYATLF